MDMTINKITITETIKQVEDLLRSEKNASPSIQAMLRLLVMVINLLLDKLNLNSTNSSIPPSADPNRKRGSKTKTKGEKRKPGGQPGHVGTNLKKFDDPDEIETFSVDRRTIPADNYIHVGYETRQVIDIEISRHVTEYRAEILQNTSGIQYVAEFPEGVTRPVQYGIGVKAQTVYMSQQQLIPYDRVQDYFSDQCNIPMSTGSLVNFNKEAYDLLENFEKIAQKKLIGAEVLNADETGINVNGSRLWLHSASNDLWSLFFPHEKRGLKAMVAMGILEKFNGVLCHDHWKPYFHFKCLHALCNAHHIRELEHAAEQDDQKWAKEMQSLLLTINETVKNAGGFLATKESDEFLQKYRLILAKGNLECPAPEENKKQGRTKRSKSRNLLERLTKFETETLRFMNDPKVPFTNNRGENDIRMTKVQQKISGCFRSMEGSKIFCRVRSYLLTCKKHGIKPTEALRILFSKKLPDFVTKLE